MYEVVAKTPGGWKRLIGVYQTETEAELAAETFTLGEGVDTMVRPREEKVGTV